jgi:hypothetical protein
VKSLTYQQAAGCEHATTPRCRCRCGGQFHGAGRGEVAGLPQEDPHGVDLPAGAGVGVQLELFPPPTPKDWLNAARKALEAPLPAEPGPGGMVGPAATVRRLERPPAAANDEPDELEVEYAY